jgi:DNA-binding SARP family transcriptional activator
VALLAFLLVNAKQAVASEQIVEILWPGQARVKTLQMAVTRLRKALEPLGHGEGRSPLRTAGKGYRLELEPDELDAHVFEVNLLQGRRALESGDPALAAELLRHAEGLWRGPAFADIAYEPFVQLEIGRLEELRMTAVENRVDAELQLGRHAALAGELEALVSRHPTRERLAGQLMLARYRCGRQADALDAYQRTRVHLMSEIGLEPGPHLRALQRSILSQDVALEFAAEEPDALADAIGVPLEGRGADLRRLRQRLARAGEGRGALVTVDGPRGMGKTRLAAELAGEATQRGFLVLYASGKGPVDAIVAAIGQALRASIPTLLVVDDADRAGLEALPDFRRLASLIQTLPVLALVTGRDREALVPMDATFTVTLEPLGVDAVRAIAGRYADPRELDESVGWLLQATGGIPHRVHEVVAEWAENAAGRPSPQAAFPAPAIAPRTSDGIFVGREACLERLRLRWRDARQGRTGFVLVEGEPGIGKTRLAARFAEEAQSDGGAVIYGRADEDALLPYQPFAEALQHLVDNAGTGFKSDVGRQRDTLSLLFPALGDPDAIGAAGVDEPSRRYQAFDAVVAVLAQASARWPLLIVIDDLHWADKPTRLLLRHVLRRAPRERLLVVGACRPPDLGEGDALLDFLAELYRDLPYERLILEGLDEEQTHALVVDRLGVDVTSGFVQELQESTGGNAFFIEETARALRAAGRDREGRIDAGELVRAGVPEGVRSVISHRVKRLGKLDPLVPDCLTAASVVGPTFHFDVVEKLVDAGPDAVMGAIEKSMAAGLVSEVRDRIGVFTFSHAIVRHVLDEQLSDTRRVDVHHRAAKALKSLGRSDNPAELAHHFALAQERAGSAPARDYAIEAGRRAAAMFAYDEAVGHFRRALELFDDGCDETQRCDLLLELGRVEWHAGGEGARQTFLKAADSAARRSDAEQLAEAAVGVGERFFEVTYLGNPYRKLLETALSAIGPGDCRWRVLLLSRLATNLSFPHDKAEAHACAEEAVAIARRLADDRLLIPALLGRHVTLLDVRYLDERLAVSEQLASLAGEHQELTAERHYVRMYDLLGVGDLEGARREAAALQALAGVLGQPLLRSLALGTRSLWAELEGDIELAEQCTEDFRGQAELARTRDAKSSWASQLFAMRRRVGRRALEALEPDVEELAGSGGAQIGWKSALGVLRCEIGDVKGGRRIFEEEMSEGAAGLPRGMFWLTRIALLSELSAMLGDELRARDLYAALAPHAARNVVVAYCSFWGPVDTYLAQLAQTFGDEAAAAGHARAALARTRAMNAPLLTEDLQARHGDLGHTSRARITVRRH